MRTSGIIMCGRYKIALYTVLQSAVNGYFLLLLVRVRDAENAPIMVAYSCNVYSLRRITFKVVTFVNITRVS